MGAAGGPEGKEEARTPGGREAGLGAVRAFGGYSVGLHLRRNVQPCDPSGVLWPSPAPWPCQFQAWRWARFRHPMNRLK